MVAGWPFWEIVLEDSENWKEIMTGYEKLG